MKVLWMCYSGSWIWPLLDEIKKNCNVRLLMPSHDQKGTTKEIINGVIVYKVGITKDDVFHSMTKAVYERKYKEVIDEFVPDIIHVHGTEKNLAQIQKYVPHIPVVISIQGILHNCYSYSNAFLKTCDIMPFKSIKNVLGFGGISDGEKICHRGAKNYEDDIFRNGKYFFGRTMWDKAYVNFSNPSACYYSGEELLRPAFYQNQGMWHLENCNRHNIFMPSGFNPIKGLHFAIRTVALLKKFFPDVKLIVPGLPLHIYNRKGMKSLLLGEEFLEYVKYLVRSESLADNIKFMPRLDEHEMVIEMLHANVFLSPSTIDNSPNAIGEATMVGLPIVTTPVGGVLSFMHDRENCLVAPSGDEYMMAWQIKRIFDDDKLAIELGHNAYNTALIRHDKATVPNQYISAYQEILNIHHRK